MTESGKPYQGKRWNDPVDIEPVGEPKEYLKVEHSKPEKQRGIKEWKHFFGIDG